MEEQVNDQRGRQDGGGFVCLVVCLFFFILTLIFLFSFGA